MYTYRATVLRVYDGDTITVSIDLGFGVRLEKQTIRLRGIDTPEIRGEERAAGIQSKRYLAGRIDGREVQLRTHRDKKGKYGRWIADVYVREGDNGVWCCVNDELVEQGLAKRVDYGRRPAAKTALQVYPCSNPAANCPPRKTPPEGTAGNASR